MDGGVGTLSSVAIYLVDSPDEWSRRSFQDRYINPGACFDPHFLGANADLHTVTGDLSLKTRILHDRNVPHGLPNRSTSQIGKRMFAWARAQVAPSVSYTSSRPDVVKNTGEIRQPAFGQGAALTEITARVVSAGAVDIRRAVIKVLEAAPGQGGRDSLPEAALDRAHRIVLGCQPPDGVVQHLPPPAIYQVNHNRPIWVTITLISSTMRR